MKNAREEGLHLYTWKPAPFPPSSAIRNSISVISASPVKDVSVTKRVSTKAKHNKIHQRRDAVGRLQQVCRRQRGAILQNKSIPVWLSCYSRRNKLNNNQEKNVLVRVICFNPPSIRMLISFIDDYWCVYLPLTQVSVCLIYILIWLWRKTLCCDPASRPRRLTSNHSSIVHTWDKAEGKISLRYKIRWNSNMLHPAVEFSSAYFGNDLFNLLVC